MIKRIALLSFFLTTTLFARGFYPQHFLEDFANSKNPKIFLQKIAREGHRALGYYQARKIMFGIIDIQHDENGNYIEDVYCLKKFRAGAGVASFKIPNHNQINCEHSWPQSKFVSFDSSFQKSDIHHLYPSDSKANSTRANHPFANIDYPTHSTLCSPSHIGLPAEGVNSSSNYFEPPEKYKGDIARSQFYFSIRYKAQINDNVEKFLRLWSQQDPVDQKERERNNQIYNYQGNRNPFVDFPELVEKIDNF